MKKHRKLLTLGVVICLVAGLVVDESRQEFVSNVSHELKTPMTSMKVLADSLVRGGQKKILTMLCPVFLYRALRLC